jgi:hypothetical protein
MSGAFGSTLKAVLRARGAKCKEEWAARLAAIPSREELLKQDTKVEAITKKHAFKELTDEEQKIIDARVADRQRQVHEPAAVAVLSLHLRAM